MSRFLIFALFCASTFVLISGAPDPLLDELCKTLYKNDKNAKSVFGVQNDNPCRFDCYVNDHRKGHVRVDGSTCTDNKICINGICSNRDGDAVDVCKQYFARLTAGNVEPVGSRDVNNLCVAKCFHPSNGARANIPMPYGMTCRSGNRQGTCQNSKCVV